MDMTFRLKALLISITVVLVNGSLAERIETSMRPSKLDAENYVLGTQTIGVKYQFTKETTLVETAERIQEMGSNILKFSLSRRYKGDQYSLPARDDITSLVNLASKEPSVKAVLDMPFAYYLIWAYPFSCGDAPFLDGLSNEERDDTHKEVFALATYLLTTYAGTGKTFFLGHWEGDWHLLGGTDRNKTPEALTIKGMKGGTCLVNDVLPSTTVDYVSYSSYDTTIAQRDTVRGALRQALDYIEQKLPPKEGLNGKRVFIGEYGFPLDVVGTPEKQDKYSRDVCLAALEWGCPFVLYWEMYCNEITAKGHRGFWLIDDKNRKQPFYYTLQSYYQNMRKAIAEFRTARGRPPADSELRQIALESLKTASSSPPAPSASE